MPRSSPPAAMPNAILMERFGLPFLASFTLAGIVTGLAGVLIAIPVLRLHGIYLAIATLALSILTEDIIVLAEPVDRRRGRSGGAHDHHRRGGGGPLRLARTLLLALPRGRAARDPRPTGTSCARRWDGPSSRSAIRRSRRKRWGVNLARTKAAAFGLSCMVTGWAGALMGHFFFTFNHEVFTIVISIQLLLMIVIGGLGSIQGAWYGAIVVGDHPAGDQRGAGLGQGRDWWRRPRDPRDRGRHLRAHPGLLHPVRAARHPRPHHEVEGLVRSLPPFYRRDMFRRQKSYLRTERMR